MENWNKKRSLIKVLDNAKVYRIKGGRFYRIGKNRFVKVGNVEKFTIQINMHATIAGRKNRKVHVSNSNGKHINKYVIAGHNYRFDRKKVIKGEVYYRIANKDQWIKENKLIFK
ncbi:MULTISPECIES: SLAP domain-containing protein [Lactobacillus]|uniref:SLAP domain-containing protein n=1 Tax=Lactobacillus TaxID=1578 RepID=UPI00258FA17A|nr:SLAP domain-containing protein [Lactobacillus sp. N54.MGS-719]